jgi:hypothetical protein
MIEDEQKKRDCRKPREDPQNAAQDRGRVLRATLVRFHAHIILADEVKMAGALPRVQCQRSGGVAGRPDGCDRRGCSSRPLSTPQREGLL